MDPLNPQPPQNPQDYSPGATPTPQPTPPPPPPAYQPAPAYQPGVVAPVSEADAKLWSMAAHLGGAFLSFLVPLVVYLVYKDRSPFVRQHASEALNFQITAFIGYVVSVILMFVIIGIFTFAAIALCAVIFAILGTVAANEGRPYSYPVNIRFVS